MSISPQNSLPILWKIGAISFLSLRIVYSPGYREVEFTIVTIVLSSLKVL